jgi:hypothetical protein
MLFPDSVIDATMSLYQYPPGSAKGQSPLFMKETELLGEFWICTDYLKIEGAVEFSLSCHASFVPDDQFQDGDRSEKCLQLRRVWVEAAPEPGDG